MPFYKVYAAIIVQTTTFGKEILDFRIKCRAHLHIKAFFMY